VLVTQSTLLVRQSKEIRLEMERVAEIHRSLVEQSLNLEAAEPELMGEKSTPSQVLQQCRQRQREGDNDAGEEVIAIVGLHS
jgi:hypothetical protein